MNVELLKLLRIISAPKLAIEVKKYLGKSMYKVILIFVEFRRNKYHGQVTGNKTYISHQNRKKRKEFAREYLKKDFDFWKVVIVTDESKYNIF